MIGIEKQSIKKIENANKKHGLLRVQHSHLNPLGKEIYNKIIFKVW